jgi:flagellar M-ring protein FliF
MSSGASTSDSNGVARWTALAKGALDRGRAFVAGMSRPAKVLAVSTLIAAVVLVGLVAWRSGATEWAVLFSNLDREDASAVLAKLKEMKVPYRVEGDGGTIEVPQANVHELRLELAGAGVLRSGGVGFESFDKMRLGATEFEQRVLFRRALEGELARTIDTLSSVQSARVHLVLPERSVFISKSEPSSASVVLKLRSGRALGQSEIAGIVHLVASSVSGLAPERVAVVTTDGAMLHKPRQKGADAAPAIDDDEHEAAARTMEATLEERARTMLEKVVGVGRVDVRVRAEIDRARTERVEDRYDPQRSAVRSEERSVERRGQEDVSAAGVPGAESNVPGGNGRARPDGGVDDATLRESYTRNFEVDHVVEKRLVTSGTIRRLTVAVVLDPATRGGPSRSKEEIDRIGALVKSAVGADDRRGDLVTVEAIPFSEPEAPVAPAPPEPTTALAFTKGKKWPLFAAGGVVLAGIVAAVGVARARRRRAASKIDEARSLAALPTAPKAAEALPEEEDLADLSPDELRAKVLERAARDPATAALVLRFWLAAGEPSQPSDDDGIRVAST